MKHQQNQHDIDDDHNSMIYLLWNEVTMHKILRRVGPTSESTLAGESAMKDGSYRDHSEYRTREKRLTMTFTFFSLNVYIV